MPFRTIAREAHELLNRQRASGAAVAEGLPETFWDCARELLEPLLELVHEQPDQPADRLEPVVRRLLVERNFCCEGGCLIDEDFERCLDACVDELLQVLEQVRRLAIEQGRWYAAPAAPIMFG